MLDGAAAVDGAEGNSIFDGDEGGLKSVRPATGGGDADPDGSSFASNCALSASSFASVSLNLELLLTGSVALSFFAGGVVVPDEASCAVSAHMAITLSQLGMASLAARADGSTVGGSGTAGGMAWAACGDGLVGSGNGRGSGTEGGAGTSDWTDCSAAGGNTGLILGL